MANQKEKLKNQQNTQTSTNVSNAGQNEVGSENLSSGSVAGNQANQPSQEPPRRNDSKSQNPRDAVPKKNNIERKDKSSDSKKTKIIKLAAIIVANILFLVGTIFLLGKISEISTNLQELENSPTMSQEELAALQVQLQNNEEQAELINQIFPDQENLVGFVQEIDRLRNENVVQSFSFANNTPVKDRTQAQGLPISMRLEGTTGELDNGLRRIQDLPYLFRPVGIEITRLGEGRFELRYNGILYVDEQF